MDALPATLCLTADADFIDLAQAELAAAAPHARVVATLEPGLLLVDGIDFFVLAAQWINEPPVFVRHIAPIMAVQPLAEWMVTEPVNLETLADTVQAELLDFVEPTLPFSVQTRVLGMPDVKPFDVNRLLAGLITDATGAPINVRTPEQIVSVLITDLPKLGNLPDWGGGYALLGISPALYNLSDWAGGMRRYAREPERISRSEFKLLEALEVFDVTLPPRGVALDLGASPGGWTRILRQHEQYVTAIDPGDLDPRMAQDARVRHLRTTAEAYLDDEPDQFDLIVNDMRMDPRDSARLMVGYARCLYPTGRVIMTLKLPAHERQEIIDQATVILSRAYEIQGARQLFHNRSEITIYLTPKRSTAAQE